MKKLFQFVVDKDNKYQLNKFKNPNFIKRSIKLN